MSFHYFYVVYSTKWKICGTICKITGEVGKTTVFTAQVFNTVQISVDDMFSIFVVFIEPSKES